MMIEKFEEIIAWQKGKELAIDIYSLFKDNKDYGFKSQIERASVSIMNNIAEGFERGSKKDFKKFLYIAKASCGEVRSMLYLGLELNYINQQDFDKFYKLSSDISRLLAGFIKTLN